MISIDVPSSVVEDMKRLRVQTGLGTGLLLAQALKAWEDASRQPSQTGLEARSLSPSGAVTAGFNSSLVAEPPSKPPQKRAAKKRPAASQSGQMSLL